MSHDLPRTLRPAQTVSNQTKWYIVQPRNEMLRRVNASPDAAL